MDLTSSKGEPAARESTLNRKIELQAAPMLAMCFGMVISYPLSYPLLKIRHTTINRSTVSGNFSTRRISKAA